MGAVMKAGRMKYPLALVLALAAGWAGAAFDPMAPPRIPAGTGAAALEAEPDPVLAWVRVNGRDSIAWYGGTTVKLGEAVRGGRVMAIGEDHIVISGKNGRRTIYLLDRATRSRRH